MGKRKWFKYKTLSLVLAVCMVMGSFILNNEKVDAADSNLTLGAPVWETQGSTYKLGNLTVSSSLTGVTSAVISVDTGSVTVHKDGNVEQINKDLAGATNTIIFSKGLSSTEIQDFLRSVEFNYNSETQNISIVLDNHKMNILQGSTVTSWNGHYYMYVADKISWADAKTAAESFTYMGRQGYLATILSEEEDTILTRISKAGAWAGGSDAETEGDWKWMTGPEEDMSFPYVRWVSREPNNSGNEDYLQVNFQGGWNDLNGDADSGYISGYFVEFGGYADKKDPGTPGESLTSAATSSIRVTSQPVNTDNANGKVTVTAPSSVLNGNALSAKIAPTKGWEKPTSVTVKVGDKTLTADEYTFNAETGELTVPADKITGSVSITVADPELTWYKENKTTLGKYLGASDLDGMDTDEFSALKTGWEGLDDLQKSAVIAGVNNPAYDTAEKITQKLNDIASAKGYEDTYLEQLSGITQIDPKTENFETINNMIEAAEEDYKNLSDGAQALVSEDIKNVFKAKAFADKYTDLYEKEPVTKEDYDKLTEMAADYKNLTDEQKALVQDVYNNLNDKLAGSTVLKDHDSIITKPAPVTKEDLPMIDKALEDYDKLTDEQKAVIDPDGTIKAGLDAKKAAAEWLDTYEDILNKDAGEITSDDLNTLRDAMEAYEALGDAAKEMVGDDPVNNLIDKQKDSFIDKYVSDKNGNIYKEVNDNNYAQILSGKEDWANMTPEEKKAINDKLVEETGKTYDELIAAAEALKVVKDNAAGFVDKYLTGKDGNIFKTATKDNYKQILSGKAAWDKLTQAEKDEINAILKANGGKTYEELLKLAEAVKAELSKNGILKTGDVSNVLLWMLLMIFAGAAGTTVYTRRKVNK